MNIIGWKKPQLFEIDLFNTGYWYDIFSVATTNEVYMSIKIRMTPTILFDIEI